MNAEIFQLYDKHNRIAVALIHGINSILYEDEIVLTYHEFRYIITIEIYF